MINIEQLEKTGTAIESVAIECPACGSPDQTDFYKVKHLPAHVCLLFDSAEQARNTVTGDIILSYCHSCGFVHNRIFDPKKVTYEPGYEASLIHSSVFRSYINGVASRLIERYEILNKTVLEIGCGAGEFLSLICQIGGNIGIGIDPTIKYEYTRQVGDGTIRMIRDFFTEKYANLHCDFICCLSVFEHIPGPLNFLKNLRKIIGDRNIGIYFEVFNASHAFHNQETWSVHYEQCNYFTLQAYVRIFERSGFKVLDSGVCYEGDQYLFVEAKTDSNTSLPDTKQSNLNGKLPPEISMFAEHHQRKIKKWKDRLRDYKKQNKRVVVWGSGGKGIGFLNALNTEDLVDFVVDINPNRQNKYIPGSAQKIVSPEFLIEHRPDLVVITNPLYEQEIKNQVRELGISCSCLIA